MIELYDMIFKRKSVRLYDNRLHVSDEELNLINKKLNELVPLFPDIKLSYKIVNIEETNCNRGEYALLIYSEEKENYLMNVGDTLEQMDLFLASINIGALWYGWGKVKEEMLDNKKFVIMIAFGKCNENSFRKDYTKAKRKEIKDIWEGEILDIVNVIRYSPSACNSQPWYIKYNSNQLKLYRNTNVSALLNLTNGLKNKYNYIDMGIFMCILEITLLKNKYKFERKIIKEDKSKILIDVAVYSLK